MVSLSTLDVMTLLVLHTAKSQSPFPASSNYPIFVYISFESPEDFFLLELDGTTIKGYQKTAVNAFPGGQHCFAIRLNGFDISLFKHCGA